MEAKINVVLVHGAWADASSWSKVILLLDKKGLNVTAVQLPLTSLEDDIAVTKVAQNYVLVTSPPQSLGRLRA